MRVAIMQPYFFPYLGYFQLIRSVDRFILFDDVQYIRHGWINRNRILKPGESWQYIVAPLQKHAREDLISGVELMPGSEWKEKILRQLDHYRKKAPFYCETISLLNECFALTELNITRFNAYCLKLICQRLDLPFEIEISSEMNFNYDNVTDAGEWALRMCEQLKATSYINPAGGQELFDRDKFNMANIKLYFLVPVLEPYDQKRNVFEAGLSILDVLMFNGIESTKRKINTFVNTAL
jgi:hypothetical protein